MRSFSYMRIKRIIATIATFCLLFSNGFSQEESMSNSPINDSLLCDLGNKFKLDYSSRTNHNVLFVPILKTVRDSINNSVGISISAEWNYNKFESYIFDRYIKCDDNIFFVISNDTIYNEQKHLSRVIALHIASKIYNKKDVWNYTMYYHIYEFQSDSMIFFKLSEFDVPFEYRLDSRISTWLEMKRINSNINPSLDSILDLYPDYENFK